VKRELDTGMGSDAKRRSHAQAARRRARQDEIEVGVRVLL
jgi:hypothetical protein